MSYTSSCHCGTVSATVEGDIPTRGMSCNCSICRRKGHLLHFEPAANVALTAPEGRTGSYTFNKGMIAHMFCQTCGCSPFAAGKAPDGSEMVAINLRCVPECDLDALEIHKVDGASF